MGTESHILIHEMIDGHEERMINLKKFYPFFRLCDHALTQFREGRYERIDMGYVTMAVLRFFIEENSFNDRKVVYEEYESFMRELLCRDFYLDRDDTGITELIQYIFDKITNEGRPFCFEYYEPKTGQKKAARTRLIESHYQEGIVAYTISSDAVEFYLETKEMKDESRISIEQLLLNKMIRSKNFKGGLEVIRRINSEVTRLMLKQNEIVTLLSHNIFEGVKELDHFSKSGLRWFDEEQKLFDTNLELVKKALLKAQEEDYNSHALDEIFCLNQELKRAMDRHEALLSACTKLQIQADEMMIKAKHSRFRRRMDFSDLLRKAMEKDDIRLLESMVSPLFGVKIKKTMGFGCLDECLLCRNGEEEKGEAEPEGIEENYVFEDEIEEERIYHNFSLLLRILFDTLLSRKSLTLEELQHLYIMKFTENILNNGDYYGFLAHLSQKDYYQLLQIREKPDTFLEEIMAELVMKDRNKNYEDLSFSLEFLPDQKLDAGKENYITNIRFERQGM